MTDSVWNERSSSVLVEAMHRPLPVGLSAQTCPQCGSGALTGAIVVFPDGHAVIESADEADPNVLCLSCGYWFDSEINSWFDLSG